MLDQWLPGIQGEGGLHAAREYLGYWNYSVCYYNDRYTTLGICQKPLWLYNTKSEP